MITLFISKNIHFQDPHLPGPFRVSYELKKILDQFSSLIDRWNAEEIQGLDELVSETRALSAKLREELIKPQKEQTSIPPAEA